MLYRIRSGRKTIRTQYDNKDGRTLHVTGVTGGFGFLLGLGKLLAGLLAMSLFACMNGLCTLGMAAARYSAMAGGLGKADSLSQYAAYRRAGLIMAAASLFYVIYSLWSIFHPKAVTVAEIPAITIAAITFGEIGWNLWGMLKHRKRRAPMFHALKTISLGSSLISLVLTQAALLSFSETGPNPWANGILGAVMGLGATALGIYLVWRNDTLEKQRRKQKGGRSYGSHLSGG